MPETPTDAPAPPAKPKHDAAYKRFFAHRRTVEDTLRALDVAVSTADAGKRDREVDDDFARRLDFATLERMPASFVTEHLGRRHADMLWGIRTFDETWLHLLVLFEFQSTVDRRMAFRMMNYAGGIWMGLESKQLGPGRVLPLVVPVVVYNGQRRWTAPKDIRDLLTPVPVELLGSRPRHPYILIEVQRLGAPPLPEDNVLSMIVALEQARSSSQIEKLARSLRGWAERVGAQELLDSFTEWISQVLVQRLDSKGRKLELRVRNEQEGKMTTLIERARQWGEELNQEWHAKGHLAGERALVRRLAARRFGQGAVEDLVPVLEDIADSERLAAIAAAVFTCETADDFLSRVREAAQA